MKKLYKYPLNSKRWYEAHKDEGRVKDIYTNTKLKNRYGISLDEYRELFRLQGSRCKICNVHQDNLSKKLHVDHDHKTREVRGLLCRDCNNGLGHFKDQPNRLIEAVRYLGAKMKMYTDEDIADLKNTYWWTGAVSGAGAMFLLCLLCGVYLIKV